MKHLINIHVSYIWFDTEQKIKTYLPGIILYITLDSQRRPISCRAEIYTEGAGATCDPPSGCAILPVDARLAATSSSGINILFIYIMEHLRFQINLYLPKDELTCYKMRWIVFLVSSGDSILKQAWLSLFKVETLKKYENTHVRMQECSTFF
jgi:hypothetical protein